ncbi:LysM and putative peptidoglycan-binding domain-containing protein 2 [Xenoophorus captivus]|uniref:LysM and putative peptidoglycan-binding domain-containing protein 2 n=1 Tax=Xenoophorus captivus TaxID=1517983 RepID=A0ABV0RFJ4_9TELE
MVTDIVLETPGASEQTEVTALFIYSEEKMAEFSPVLSMRDGGGRLVQPIFPRSRSGSESESELSQSLARTKIRSYGSTASVTASLGEKYIEHRVTDSDTLQGIALKYGVTVRLLPC